jgi:hypothetical protein
MSLASTPGDQRAQQLADVYSISLRPPVAAIDLHARRINTRQSMPRAFRKRASQKAS